MLRPSLNFKLDINLFDFAHFLAACESGEIRQSYIFTQWRISLVLTNEECSGEKFKGAGW